MNVRSTICFLVLIASASRPVFSQEKKSVGNATNTSPGLEKFKKLAGEWEGKEMGKGKEIHAQYKVTSGGSAVIETLFPGTDHEMVTIIHQDGDDLILTHYCMLGNQPQMKASGKILGDKIEFKFVRATNLKSEKDMHMHDVTYTFVDGNRLRTEWVNYTNGKDAGHVIFELKRKK